MSRWIITALLCALALSCAAAAEVEEPVLPEQSDSLEIEPPLLIKSRDRDGLPEVPATPQSLDVAKLEKDLARAKSNAASGERLFKMGAIAKVDAEARALRVVRLEAQLADARLEAAKNKSAEEPKENDDELAQAKQAAERAAAERRRAEIDAALQNVNRQKKLLALGVGRKADVSRAEKKLADLQQPGD